MVTIDTNIAIYALGQCEKADRAENVLASMGFLSVQVLNEFAFVAQRKFRRNWFDISRDLELLREVAPLICPLDDHANRVAVKLTERYRFAFFDALMIAVALANDASILYSEDMQHGMVIDDKLTIINPFL